MRYFVLLAALCGAALIQPRASLGADPPIFVQHPQSQTVAVGGTAIFHVEVTGTEPFGYRWRRNGITVTPFGAGTDTLIISNVQPSHAGTYNVIATNAANLSPGVLSSNAVLTVLTNSGGAAPTGNLIAISNLWRYNESGADLGSGWSDRNYDDAAWNFGVSTFGFETAPLPVPINTPLRLGPITYYFRTWVSLSESQLNPLSQFRAHTLIDDGAVVYVNGAEVLRLRLPAGPIHAGTLATTPPTGDATFEGPFTIPTDRFVVGANLVAVEVHQAQTNSGDIVFAMTLNVQPGQTNQPLAPTITQHPQSQTVEIGGTAVFHVEVTGTPPFGYRWRRNAVTIVPFGTDTLVISNAQPSDAGDYTVIITNAANPLPGVISTPARLTVISDPENLPVITRHPESQTVPQGGSATFVVEATGAELSYRWHKTPFSVPIAGATNPVFTLNNVTNTDAGFYYASVSNFAGTVFSSNAQLQVTIPPRVPPMITSFSPHSGPPGTMVTITGMNFSTNRFLNTVYFGALRAPVPLSASTTSLTVQVPVGATYAPIIVTVGSDTVYSIDQFLPTFNGANAISTSSFAERITVNAGDGPAQCALGDIDWDNKVDVVVANYYSSQIAIHKNRSTNGILNPESFGSPVTFSTGLEPYHLVLADINGDRRLDAITANLGDHTVSVLRNAGPGTNIVFAAPINLAVGQSPVAVAVHDLNKDGRADIIVANRDSGTISIFRNNRTGGVLTGTNTFAPRIDIAVGDSPHGVAVGDIDGDGLPDIAVANHETPTLTLLRNTSDSSALSFASPVSFPRGGLTLAIGDLDRDGRPDIAVGHWRAQNLAIFRNTAVPGSIAEDSLAAPVDFAIGNNIHAVAFSDLNGDARPDLVLVGELPSYMSVLQNVSTPGSLSAGSFGQRLDFPSGWNATGVAVGDLDGDTRPDITFANFYDDNLNIYRNVIGETNVGEPPVIVQQPESQTIIIGGAALFRVEATGTPPLGYRWRRDGVVIPGANNSTLVISNAQPGHAGVYTVVVSNPVNPGGVVSAPALLTVIEGEGPVIVQQPESQTVMVGGSAAFHVEATGTSPLGYRWRKDGVTISGANTDTLVISNVQEGDGGVYTVVVTNPMNPAPGVVSAPALLTVIEGTNAVPPTITRQPENQTVAAGGTATFSVEATGTPPLSYQWFRGGAEFAGQTSSVLTISNVSISDANYYSVRVNNSAGSVMSSNALLSVATMATPVPPMITSFTPQSGPTGTVVTINGMNFSTNPIANTVYFGAVRARVLAGGSDALTVEVPGGSTYGPISVTTRNLTAYSDRPFIVTFESSRTIHQRSFGPGFNLAAGDLPVHVSIGDMNRDGRPDLVVANTYSGNIGVYLNKSTNDTLEPASFAPPVYFPSGPDPYFMALADLDGDARLDVVTPNINNGSVTVLRNVSGLTNIMFAPPLSLPVGQLPIAVAVGDLDKDGRPDIVTANHDSDSISIYRNLGARGSTNPFAARVDFTVGDGPHNLVIGDIDGDGRQDIAVANYQTPTMAVLRNLTTSPGINTGSFAPAMHFARGGNCMAFGDLDGDGRNDIAIGNWRTQTLSLFHNIASPGAITLGSLAVPVDFSMGNNPHTIALSDLDGDARPDIVLVGELNSYMSIFQNLSSPGTLPNNSFGTRIDFPSGWNAVGVAAGDLDGDSRPDLVFANAYDDNITVYQNFTTLPPNSAPIARASASPAIDFLSDETTFVILAPDSTRANLVLDGSLSTDPDGQSLTHEWFINGSGVASGAVISNVFLLVGSYEITLRVFDGLEAGLATIRVEVIEPAAAVQALIVLVDQSTLPRRSKRPIIASLKGAIEKLERHQGHDNDRQMGIHQLEKAQEKIDAQIAPSNPELAALLNAAIQEIIDALDAAP